MSVSMSAINTNAGKAPEFANLFYQYSRSAFQFACVSVCISQHIFYK